MGEVKEWNLTLWARPRFLLVCTTSLSIYHCSLYISRNHLDPGKRWRYNQRPCNHANPGRSCPSFAQKPAILEYAKHFTPIGWLVPDVYHGYISGYWDHPRRTLNHASLLQMTCLVDQSHFEGVRLRRHRRSWLRLRKNRPILRYIGHHYPSCIFQLLFYTAFSF